MKRPALAHPCVATPGAGSSGCEIIWHGQRLILRCDRTAWWPAAATLIVADPHFGKAATFRAAGVPVPAGTTGETLGRLDAALTETGARRLLFLGDLFHARSGVDGALLSELAVWRGARGTALEVVNVRGNHDRHAGDPPESLGIACVAGPWSDPLFPGLGFVHDPAETDGSDAGGVVAGHLHPAVVLEGAGRVRMRCACFHFRARVALMPAFGAFTGMHPVRVGRGDRVFAVGPDAVVEVGGRETNAETRK